MVPIFLSAIEVSNMVRGMCQNIFFYSGRVVFLGLVCVPL